MKRMILFFIVFFIIAACSPKPDQVARLVEQTLSAVPTQTAYPTYTTLPTYTPANTQTPDIRVTQQIVTASNTPTPLLSPTPSSTPTDTPTVTPTTDLLKKSRGNGFYLVGEEIAPGIWDSDGSGTSCYWEVTNAYGDIINNHFGLAGGTAYVPTSAFQVLFEDCGNWTWLQP